MASILGVGQSALAAAQAGLATTGHNIANAATPGYSRQVVVQASAGSQNTGSGYIGKGASVVDVTRVYNELLAAQVRSAQSAQVQSQTYYSQISIIDNQLADSAGGVSPALQDFFNGVQNLASDTNAPAARQALLSSAEALAARFQGLDGQLKELAQNVNGQIDASVSSINAYAQQIAKLNDAIEKTMGTSEGKAPNDLLDQRDHAISELSKEVKATVVKQGNSYNVFIGNGQPLVVGAKPQTLMITSSLTDQGRLEIGYKSNSGQTVRLAESMFTGGRLGGLFEFRANSLDIAQNSLGRVAIGLATNFNEQHKLGQDQTGALGGDFFVVASARVDPSVKNDQTLPVGDVDASITDVSKLTTSNYRVRFDGTDYTVTRLSDNKELYNGLVFPEGNEYDGVTITEGSPIRAGDEFLIRPTADGAANFAVAINDVTKIAAAAPIRTAAPTTNTGTAKISAGTVNSFNNKVTIKFTSGTAFDVVDNTTGVTLASNVAYTAGNKIDYNGWSVQISGVPVANDTFVIDHTEVSTTSAAGTITAAVPSSPNTQFGPDPFLKNGVQVVFDSSSSYHLIGTTSNVTGGSSISGGTFAPALAAGANPGIVVTGGSATIGTGGAGAYTATGTKTTITGGTITDTGGGTFSITGATLIVEGGSNPPQSTSFSGLTVTVNAAGTIAIPATASNTQIASTFRSTPATGLAFTANATNNLSVNGWTVQMTGTPNSGDTFTIGANNNGVGDTRNAVLLGALQSANTLANSSTTYQGAYAQLVSQIGNKTRELEVTSRAETSYLEQAVAAHESESGVNLDEEATNLLRYQQAYQAAAKMMQTASTLFDTLLAIGN